MIFQDGENHQTYARNEVVYVSGCFDLIHPGHVTLLERCRSLGGSVHVAVLGDAYVRSYKGEKRPIVPEQSRLRMVRALRFVDRAWIAHSSPNTDDAIARVQPRVIVFGIAETAEGLAKQKIRCDHIHRKFPNIDIQLFERCGPSEPHSTTRIVEKVIKVAVGKAELEVSA